MHLLWSLIVGLVVGAIAKLVMPGKDPGGIIITMLLGVAGSIVASLLGGALGLYHRGDTGPGTHRLDHRFGDPAGGVPGDRRPPDGLR